MQLTSAQWKNAAVFMQTMARPLEQTLFDYHFGNGSVAIVLDKLAEFQNEDGGFGHGLEPDMQVTDSSVLATTVALQRLRALGTDSSELLVRQAIQFLQRTYSPKQQSWSFIPPSVKHAPHAPWWRYDADYTKHWHNPRPEVVGYLLDWEDSDLGRQILSTVLDTASTTKNITMHDLYCYLRLLKTAALPDNARRILIPLIKNWATQLVEINPQKWGEYGLRPLNVAPTPNSLLVSRFADVIEIELDYLVQEQQMDGAWWPTWSWGETASNAWQRAKQAWKGVITLKNLLTLQAYGRLSEIVGA